MKVYYQHYTTIFVRGLKKHLEFTKLVEIMETQGAKILKNNKRWWINICYPMPNMLWHNTWHCWWGWPSTTLVMKRQRWSLTSFVMCRSCWGLLLYFPYLNLPTIAPSSNWGMYSCAMLWQQLRCIKHKYFPYTQTWTSLMHFEGCKTLVCARHEFIIMCWFTNLNTEVEHLAFDVI